MPRVLSQWVLHICETVKLKQSVKGCICECLMMSAKQADASSRSWNSCRYAPSLLYLQCHRVLFSSSPRLVCPSNAGIKCFILCYTYKAFITCGKKKTAITNRLETNGNCTITSLPVLVPASITVVNKNWHAQSIQHIISQLSMWDYGLISWVNFRWALSNVCCFFCTFTRAVNPRPQSETLCQMRKAEKRIA